MKMWYNYKTDEYEARKTPTTDEEAKQLIPQYNAAQSLYSLYREYRGLDVLEAMTKVLEAACGKSDSETP